MSVQEMAQSTKLAAGIAASTTAAGVGEIFGWIPDDIGKLAALIGCVLTTVLIITHLRKLYKTWDKDSSPD